MLVSNSSLVSIASNDSDYTVSGNALENYTGSAINIVLPTEVGGQVVTSTYQTFRNNTSIKTVVVPEGYTLIGASTFEGCSSLEKVTLPSTLTKINGNAFKNCTALGTAGESIIIPSSVTTIMASVFDGCTNPDLVIDIRSTNTTAGFNAFKNVVGTIYVYSQSVYDAVIKRAPSANVVLRTEIPTDPKPTDPPTPSLDYTNLNKALEDGEAVDTSKYTEATAKALEEAILSGKAVKDNTTATQTDIDNAASAIREAMKGLIIALNYTELDARIAKAEDIIVNHSDEYTEESIADLQWALSTANEVRAKDETVTTQATVDYASNLVQIWIERLVKITVPAMSDLKEALAKAKDCDPNEYTESSFAVLTTAIGVAEAITDESTVADINAATKAIEEAIAGLEYLPADYTAVEEAKAKVPADLSVYTDETVNALNEALNSVVEGKNITEQAVVDGWAKAIEDAIAKLEEKIKTGTVSGTINVSDKSAGTEITITAVSADETKEEISVTATSMGTYTIENLETGDYTLIISGGKYTARNYKVTVTESGITQDAELNPYGDVNGDGKVTTADVGLANAHAKGVRILEGYAFDCANVKVDGEVSIADVGMINSHAKGVTALW